MMIMIIKITIIMHTHILILLHQIQQMANK